MDTLKTTALAKPAKLLVGAALLVTSSLGFADHRYEHNSGYHKSYNTGYSDHYGHRIAKADYYSDRVHLTVPVHLDGYNRIGLKRLIRQYHDINLDHYALHKVVIKNRSRRGYANLIVGDYETTPTRLRRSGRTHIPAPTDYADGRWRLHLKDVHTDRIRVVLKPKHGWAYAHKKHRKGGKGYYRDDYYSDNRHYNKPWKHNRKRDAYSYRNH